MYEIFDGNTFLGDVDAPNAELALLFFINRSLPEGSREYASVAEAKADSLCPHRNARAASAFLSLPSAPVSDKDLALYSKEFDSGCTIDKEQREAARLRAAADRTTGLEREANVRQAETAEREIARLTAQRHANQTNLPNSGHEDEDSGPRQRHQERDILKALQALGYVPQQLPKRSPGASGAKALARAKLPKMTPKVFDKAWQRLRDFGDIAEES